MALTATEYRFDDLTTPYTSYDPAKINLGKWIQKKTGTGVYDNFVGPFPLTMARTLEQSTLISVGSIFVYDWSPTISWIFLGENSGAAPTRRIVLYQFDKSTQALAWRGFITLTYPTATNHTMRGLAVGVHKNITGTVAVSGTAVTGTSTTWSTDRYAVGARIGFGSTDPTAITTWYHISAIGSDTSITLVENAGTINAGSAFVIEELRVYTTTTNATAANGGLFVAKGVNYDDFVVAGATISAATTTDNLKAVYWLADASTVLNTVSCGLAIDTTQSDTSHFLWVLNADAAATARIYKYDGRVALAGLASGKSTSAFVFRTGTAATTGNINTINNGIIASPIHDSGTKSLFFGTSRMYKCLESDITNGSTTFLTSNMQEVPPGGTNTFAASGAFAVISYGSDIDRFLIFNGSPSARQYITTYTSGSSPMTHVFMCYTGQWDQTISSPSSPSSPNLMISPIYGAASDGIVYVFKIGGGAVISGMYIWPIGAQWDYADGGGTASKQQRLITPSISTSGCRKFYRVYVDSIKYLASHITTPKLTSIPQDDPILGMQPEPFRLYYRTSGISDDSGGWTAVTNGNLSAVTAASAIQFMFEFRTMGNVCLMPRIFGLSVTYEDDSTDSHYEPSVNKSDPTNKIFAWRFSKAFGGTVPTLIVRIYDDVTGTAIAADTTASPAYGTFEKSTDGTNWVAYNTTDKGNDTTYVRYTVTGTVNGVKARAVLQQYGNQTTESGTPAGSLVKDIVFGTANTGDTRSFLLENDAGTAQPLNNILTGDGNQDALIDSLHQLPVPINNRKKVR